MSGNVYIKAFWQPGTNALMAWIEATTSEVVSAKCIEVTPNNPDYAAVLVMAGPKPS